MVTLDLRECPIKTEKDLMFWFCEAQENLLTANPFESVSDVLLSDTQEKWLKLDLFERGIEFSKQDHISRVCQCKVIVCAAETAGFIPCTDCGKFHE